MDTIEKFLQKIRTKNLRYSLEKSEWGCDKVLNVGFIVTTDTWYPNPKHIEALAARPPPKNMKELRGFISALSFYNHFLPFISDKIEPILTKLRGVEKDHSKRKRKGLAVQLDPWATEA